MSKHDNPPAFPCMDRTINNGTGEQITYQSFGGMTLRDYFAAKAMNGFLAGCPSTFRDMAHLSDAAFATADAMLAERSKQ